MTAIQTTSFQAQGGRDHLAVQMKMTLKMMRQKTASAGKSDGGQRMEKAHQMCVLIIPFSLS